MDCENNFGSNVLLLPFCFFFCQVCHSRGLDTTDVDPEALVRWLADWVELSDAAAGKKSTKKLNCRCFHGSI